MKSAITPGIVSAIERPIHRGVCRPFGGRRKTLSRRFADILKGRTAIVYDPQDLTTLFQNAGGTLPVYRPGSGQVDPPVGLSLDKGQGLELGPELMLNITNWFSIGGWSVVDGKLTISVPGAGTQCYKALYQDEREVRYKRLSVVLDITVASGTFLLLPGGYQVAATVTTSGVYSFDVFVAHASSNKYIYLRADDAFAGTVNSLSVREIRGYHAYQATPTARPKLSGRYNQLDATETLSTQSVTTAATDYTLRFEGTGTVTLSGTATGVKPAGTHTVTCTAGTLTLTVAGVVTKADLRVKRDGSSLPPYQRFDSATTYDTVGFPLYLWRDKVDDDLIVQTPAITGVRAWGSIGTVDIAAATIAAGSYQPFGTINAGEPTCTQWIAIDGTLTAAEQAALERYVYSKSKLPVGA